MKNIIIYLSWMSLFFISCEEIGLRENSNDITYLSFTKDFAKDSIPVSFLFYEEDTIAVPVELTIQGKMLTEDAEYTLSVWPDSTTLQAKNYRIPSKFIFRAGLTTDTAYITFINSEELQKGAFKLCLQVESNAYFEKGPRSGQRLKVLVTDQVTRPNWWEEDNEVQWFYLGKYSNKKYELLLEVNEFADFGAATPGERRIMALNLKRYVEDWNTAHPGDILMDEENEQPMTIPVAG